MRLEYAASILFSLTIGNTQLDIEPLRHNDFKLDEVPKNRLEILSATSDRIQGKLTRGRIGIIFESSKKGSNIFLRIKTLNGKELLFLREIRAEIIASINDRGLNTRIKKTEMIRVSRLRVDSAHTSIEAATSILKAKTKVQGVPTAIQRLKSIPEYALLPVLSWELSRLGMTGQRYSPTMAFHVVGLAAAEVLKIDPRKARVTYLRRLPTEAATAPFATLDDWLTKITGRGSKECWSEGDPPNIGGKLPPCPARCTPFPNRENNCFGMCGPGCGDCWTWICGDCCFHEFCARHDAALRGCNDATDVVLCVMAILPFYFIFTGC